MSFDNLQLLAIVAWQLLNSAANVGVWLYVRYGDRNKEVDRKFADLEAEVDRRADEHDRRLASLEVHVKHAPTHADLEKLHEKLNRTAESVSQMAGELKHMNDTLRLILSRIAERGMQ